MNFRWSQGLIFHQALVDCARAGILLPLGDKYHLNWMYKYHFNFFWYKYHFNSRYKCNFSLSPCHNVIKVTHTQAANLTQGPNKCPQITKASENGGAFTVLHCTVHDFFVLYIFVLLSFTFNRPHFYSSPTFPRVSLGSWDSYRRKSRS